MKKKSRKIRYTPCKFSSIPSTSKAQSKHRAKLKSLGGVR